MRSEIPEDYYTSQKSRLLKDFDKTVKRMKGVLFRFCGDETDTMISEAQREYEALIPQMPYIGGTQPFTQFIISTAWYLALYRVFTAHGKTLEETGEIIYKVTDSYMRRYPGFVHRLLGRRIFTRRYQEEARKRAEASQRREYPGDYVYDFIEGDGKEFDWGIDYSECGSCNFLAAHRAPELARYICSADLTYSELLRWGLTRTMTLAEGAAKCDFRFKKGGETRVNLPEDLRRRLEHHDRDP
jgi:hypothetical protein